MPDGKPPGHAEGTSLDNGQGAPTRISLAVPLAHLRGSTFDGVLIREGVYVPGIGNPKGHRIRMTSAILGAMAPTIDGKHIDLDHIRDDLHKVGTVKDPSMAGPALRAKLHFDKERSLFQRAMDFIHDSFAAKKVPNLSVEIEDITLTAAPEGEKAWDFDLTGGRFDGVALLKSGACSDAAGCGIGLTHPDITVLALQGIDTTRENTTMCDQKELVASLQAQVKALEDGAKTKTDEATQLRTELSVLKSKNTEAMTKVAAFEAAEKEALRASLVKAAPKDTDFKNVLGVELKDAEAGVMQVALKAFEASGAAGVTGFAGRRTAPPARDEKAAKEATLGLAEKHGIPLGKESKLPLRLRRNSEALLAKVASEATA